MAWIYQITFIINIRRNLICYAAGTKSILKSTFNWLQPNQKCIYKLLSFSFCLSNWHTFPWNTGSVHIFLNMLLLTFIFTSRNYDDLLCHTLTITWEFWSGYECNMTPSRANGVQQRLCTVHSSPHCCRPAYWTRLKIDWSSFIDISAHRCAPLQRLA